ncbi:hypothetical protein FGO68_gene2441 [Halteria grandinella]|uniref:Uncharacterized protein n=1 Tax=Halteria grandinella TaxID=5974 RepID=A0A8J8NP11_HALGN|nr:hypothetical protein FGO68_gene2441 [Halteria grandinella]
MAQRAMNAELVKKRLTDCNIPKLMSKAKERIREKKKQGNSPQKEEGIEARIGSSLQSHFLQRISNNRGGALVILDHSNMVINSQ